MSYLIEHVYNGHDNSVDLQLTVNGQPFPLDEVDEITVTVASRTFRSDNGVGDPILWDGAGYQVGEIRLFLGDKDLPPGDLGAWIVIYDTDHENGFVWGAVVLNVHAEVEGVEEEEGP